MVIDRRDQVRALLKAIETGAGNPGGIGFATVLRPAEPGADVVATDVTVSPGLERLVSEVSAMGRRAQASGSARIICAPMRQPARPLHEKP